MTEKPNQRPGPDRRVYVENRAKHSLEEMAKYGNQWVAWSADGSRILAHHPDLCHVARMVEDAGIPPEDTVMEWIPPGGEVSLLLSSGTGEEDLTISSWAGA